MKDKSISITEIVRRISVRGTDSRSWAAVIPNSKQNTLVSLRSELEGLNTSGIIMVSLSNSELTQCLQCLQDDPHQWALLHGFSAFRPAEWRRLDLLRSMMERPGPIIFWLSPRAASSLSVHAPNIRSYIGLSFYELSVDKAQMSVDEIAERLRSLRTRFRQTDDEVIALAKEKHLPVNPSYVEWLILLDHGELL